MWFHWGRNYQPDGDGLGDWVSDGGGRYEIQRKDKMKLVSALSCLRRSLALAFAAGVAIVALGNTNQLYAGTSSMLVRVVQNDRGGVVGRRAQEIAQIQSQGQRVEIRGSVCLSSCTMYLGSGDVCVDPKTKFGFHGPSYYGKPLKTEEFEYWSAVISSFYPQNLRNWYMTKGRYKFDGYYTLYGAQLIQMGVPKCESVASPSFY